MPEASLTYTDRITGARNWEIKAGYKTSSDIPYVDQLAQFIDSSSLYYFQLGNRNLRSNYQHNFELSASWQQENTYPASIRLAINAVSIENYISDSNYYDNRGVNINTPVNVSGYRDHAADMRFTKAFVINKKQITYALNSRISSRSVPLFANNLPVTSEQKSLTANSELGYTYSTYLGIYLLSTLDIRQSKFGSDARTNQNMTISNGLEFVADLPKGIRLNSSARMTHNRATNLPGTDLVIWNAQMSYRMGKKQNYEVKFTANDILNKTQGIYTSSNANTLVVRRTNALQQYFLVGLAYYPRFFGGNN
ncbi:outer membrane beta-barrel protein [Mucilaginibacter myungsuensis]|nr:outer membrane beta-barrel protein [Mucilaginibacter myungsuensis]MDN3597023.1 outer membrane beta-barrel protein [Mucilaginibacter myungsuensis]